MQFPNPVLVLPGAVFWLALGRFYIDWLKKKAFGQFIREEGPEAHHQKAGTPTMGGLLIIAVVLITTILFALSEQLILDAKVWAVLMVGVLLCGFGALDDGQKILKRHNKGLGARDKLLIQLGIGFALGVWALLSINPTGTVDIFRLTSIPLSWFYPVFTALLVAGFSNAYNLTDGLDGLAAGTGIMTFIGLALVTQATFPQLGALSTIIIGALLGFFWFNRYPAKVFMGDTGSLAVGGMLAAIAIAAHVESALLLLGSVYIIETLSVILQVASFKLRGTRIFKMAPIHHHFELCGWHETQIVLAFTLFQAISAALALFVYN